MRSEKPQELRLTPGRLVRIKDNIGNTLGTMQLDEEMNLLIYPTNRVEISDNPLTVCIPTRK